MTKWRDRPGVAGLLLAAGGGRRYGMPKALVTDDGGRLLVERAVATLREGGCDPVVVVLGASADEVLARADLAGAVPVINPDWASGMGSSLRAGLAALAGGATLDDAALTEGALGGAARDATALNEAALGGAGVGGAGLDEAAALGAVSAPGEAALLGAATGPGGAAALGPAAALGAAALGSSATVPKAVCVLLVDTPGITPEAVRRLAGRAAPAALAVATYHGEPGHPVLLGRDHWSEVAGVAVGDVGARRYLARHPDLVTNVPCDDIAVGDDLDEPS